MLKPDIVNETFWPPGVSAFVTPLDNEKVTYMFKTKSANITANLT